MSGESRPRSRRKTRRVIPVAAFAPPAVSAPPPPPQLPQPAPLYVETWRTVSGEGLQCELYAAEDDAVVCGIMHEPTRTVEVEDLPGAWPLTEGSAPADSAKLACGHVFHPAALALHFLVSDMRCPVCRTGPAELMDIESVPVQLRPAYAEKTQRIHNAATRPEDAEQLQRDVLDVLSNLEMVMYVLAESPSTPPRAAVRTRVVFEQQHVTAILERMQEAPTDPHNFSSEFAVHRSFQRLVRGVVGRQHAHNPAVRVRFALMHPLVPVTIASDDMPVTAAWDDFFNCAPGAQCPQDSPASGPAPTQIPLYCAAVAGSSPVGFLKAAYLDAVAAPQLTVDVNTLMLVNIAGYVREVIMSIRDAVEQHTGFDSMLSVEVTAHAINGVVFE
jgi:hypothetical protein